MTFQFIAHWSTEFTNQLLLPALQCLNHSDLNRPYQNLNIYSCKQLQSPRQQHLCKTQSRPQSHSILNYAKYFNETTCKQPPQCTAYMSRKWLTIVQNDSAEDATFTRVYCWRALKGAPGRYRRALKGGQGREG